MKQIINASTHNDIPFQLTITLLERDLKEVCKDNISEPSSNILDVDTDSFILLKGYIHICITSQIRKQHNFVFRVKVQIGTEVLTFAITGAIIASRSALNVEEIFLLGLQPPLKVLCFPIIDFFLKLYQQPQIFK